MPPSNKAITFIYDPKISGIDDRENWLRASFNGWTSHFLKLKTNDNAKNFDELISDKSRQQVLFDLNKESNGKKELNSDCVYMMGNLRGLGKECYGILSKDIYSDLQSKSTLSQEFLFWIHHYEDDKGYQDVLVGLEYKLSKGNTLKERADKTPLPPPSTRNTVNDLKMVIAFLAFGLLYLGLSAYFAKTSGWICGSACFSFGLIIFLVCMRSLGNISSNQLMKPVNKFFDLLPWKSKGGSKQGKTDPQSVEDAS